MQKLIGRQVELDTMRAALEAARSADGTTVVLVSGEAGIGKSALIRAFAQSARESAALVLQSACTEDRGAPAYWPWIQITRAMLERLDGSALARALCGITAPVAELLPELLDRVPHSSSPAPITDGAQARFRMFDALAQLYRRTASSTSLVMILEDVHWADTASLHLLAFLASQTQDAGLLLIASFRDEGLARDDRLYALQRELQRSVRLEHLRLRGLAPAHLGKLIQVAGAHNPTQGLLHFIQAKTDGHPLYAIELARQLAHEGVRAPDDSAYLPPTLRALIASRVQQLSPMTRAVMSAAAVIGVAFDLQLLHALMPTLTDDEFFQALDEARAGHLISTNRGHEGVAFSHTLTRDALYANLPSSERARLHHAVALALEQERAPAVLLAHHYANALPLAAWQLAVRHAHSASEAARAQYAHEDAARWLLLALDALKHAPQSDLEPRCKTLIALGRVRIASGHMELAMEALTTAAGDALQAELTSELVEAALEYEEAAWRLALPTPRSRALLELALNAIAEEDVAAHALLLSAMVRVTAFSGLPDDARALHQHALMLARKADNPQALMCALRSRFWLPWDAHELDEILAGADQTLALAQRLGSTERALDASVFRLHLMLTLGDMQGFIADLQRFTEFAETLQQPFHRYHALTMRSAHAMAQGRLDDAQALARRAFELGQRLPGMDPSGVYGVQMFSSARERGELAALGPLVRQFVASAADSDVWQPALCLILAEVGEHETARAKLERLRQLGFGVIARDSLHLAALAYLAEASALLREREAAHELDALLAPWSGRNVVAGSAIACYGPVDRLLGMLCTVTRDFDRGERHFDCALAATERQDSPYWTEQAQYHYAEMLLERARPEDIARAGTLLARARNSANALGLARLQALILALDTRRAAKLKPPALPCGLSEREAQILRLVAQGKSNQEIADTLARSPNTIANHVRNILSKLRSANRTEAATYAARHGLL
jgi:DNA-binding NarL/FixJ family response regulator